MNPLLTIICFKGVGEKPPTSSKFIGWHLPPWVSECLEFDHQWCYHSVSLYQLAFHFKHFWHTECSLSERRTIIIRGVQQSWSRLKLKRRMHVILSWILVILDLLRSFWDLFFNHTNWVHVQKIGCIKGSKPLGEIVPERPSATQRCNKSFSTGPWWHHWWRAADEIFFRAKNTDRGAMMGGWQRRRKGRW